MKRIESWKAWAFIGSLAILAIMINASQGYMRRQNSGEVYRDSQAIRMPPTIETVRPETQNTSPAPEQTAKVAEKTPAELAAERAVEHARYLARYLVNPSVARKDSVKNVAIAVVSEDRKFNRALTTAIANRLKNEKLELSSSFFTPEFVSDGLFDDALGNSPEVLKNLELGKRLVVLLLARQRVTYSPNPSLQNVLTANMQLEVMICPVATPDENRTWTLTANGAGFTEKEARTLAEERLVKQIASDPKIALPETTR